MNSSPNNEPQAPLPPPPALTHVPLPPDYAAYQQALSSAPIATPLIEDPSPPAEPRRGFMAFWRQIGGGSLSLSIALHVGLLLLAGWVVFSQTHRERNIDFLPGGGTAQGAKASQELRDKTANRKRTTLTKSTPMVRIGIPFQTDGPVIPETPLEMIQVGDHSAKFGGSMGSQGHGTSGAGTGFRMGTGPGSAPGFAPLPPVMKARCSSLERMEKLRQNGGSVECEVAVSRSLEWFKTHQNKDGSWGSQHKAAMTGLTLLSYFGRCETPDSLFYGDEVMKGILYLIQLSHKNRWGIIAENPQDHAACYEHGIATYALGEMYSLARLGSKSLPGMKEAFETGVKRIIEMQLADGGWGYGDGGEFCYRSNGRGDLSVTGWQYQALKAAKHTQLRISGLHDSIAKAVKYLESTQTKDGGFGAATRDTGYNQWNLSGCGILGLQTLGNNKTAAVGKGMRFMNSLLSAEPLDWNKNCNLYCWYYYTQAAFQQGGKDWTFYNTQFMPQLLNNQSADGEWKPERPNSPIGSTSPAGADRAIYRQALCTLMLEVYYRYLKVADREEPSFLDR